MKTVPTTTFEQQLCKAGLSPKEAAVYIAALSLGPQSVQRIARKAKVARGTTYVMIEKLMKRGLMTSSNEGKRQLFIAESPDQLLCIVDQKQQELNTMSHDIQSLLPKLHAVARHHQNKTVVRYYTGLRGLEAMRQEMVAYSRPGDVWYNLTPVDPLRTVFGDDNYVYDKQRVARSITAKTIFSTASETVRKNLLLDSRKHNTERRFVPLTVYNSDSGFTVYRDRVALGLFNRELGGIIIESEAVATMMRQFFHMTWDKLQ